jgi:methenyltetrahydrofolate cyclohydrolase
MSERRLSEQRIEAYLGDLSSRDPTPGGGAAAALTAAQGAALLVMVCSLSTGRRFAEASDEIERIREATSSGRDVLLALADADTAAFEQFMAAQRLPRDTAHDRNRRATAVQTALKAAAVVPLEMLELAVSLLPHAERLAAIGNPNLITDVGVAVRLLEAAAHSARLNVLINTRALRDPEFVANGDRRVEAALAAARRHAASCLDAVDRQVARD